jgi:cytochrome c-type protein NapB
VVPHTTWMRNDCLSCHGRTASPGLETTHAWRKNCLQCHAPSAELDQTGVPKVDFLPSPTIQELTVTTSPPDA